MDSLKITFDGADGAPLAARLETPEQAPTAFALFAHCFTCGKDSSAALRIARALAARGIAVLRFDFTGLGQSGGDFANTTFSSNIADLAAAATYLRAQGPRRQSRRHDPQSGGRRGRHRLVRRWPRPREEKVSLAGRSFTIRRQFIEDLQAQDQMQRIARLKRALLVLHAPTDDVVGIDNAAKIFQAAKHPKSFVSLHDADHLLTRAPDADYAAAIIAAWSARYVGADA